MESSFSMCCCDDGRLVSNLISHPLSWQDVSQRTACRSSVDVSTRVWSFTLMKDCVAGVESSYLTLPSSVLSNRNALTSCKSVIVLEYISSLVLFRKSAVLWTSSRITDSTSSSMLRYLFPSLPAGVATSTGIVTDTCRKTLGCLIDLQPVGISQSFQRLKPTFSLKCLNACESQLEILCNRSSWGFFCVCR